MDKAQLRRFCGEYRKKVESQDGEVVANLLNPFGDAMPIDDLVGYTSEALRSAIMACAEDRYGELLVYSISAAQAHRKKQPQEEIEFVSTCMSVIVQIVTSSHGLMLWMVPVATTIGRACRLSAIRLDETVAVEMADAEAFRKKLVEVLRAHFATLCRASSSNEAEPNRKNGFLVVVVCELLRLYFSLSNLIQCDFLLRSCVGNLCKDGSLDVSAMPQATAVTFNFWWGKQLIFMDELPKAEEKLSWAFKSCHSDAESSKRKILMYLVPCRLCLGIFPREDLFESHDIPMLRDLVAALRVGNLSQLTELLDEHAEEFIRMGTYLMMQRLKKVAYQSLSKRLQQKVRAAATNGKANQMPFDVFKEAFEWQGSSGKLETVSTLANLLDSGVMRGYMSHTHQLVVLSKECPFPPPAKCPRLS